MTTRQANWAGITGVAVAILGGPLIASGRWWAILTAVLLLAGWLLGVLLTPR